MSTLTRRKENFNRSNPFKTLLTEAEISVSRNSLTGEVAIIINSNCEDGEDKYRLTLSREEVKQIAWIWKETMK